MKGTPRCSKQRKIYFYVKTCKKITLVRCLDVGNAEAECIIGHGFINGSGSTLMTTKKITYLFTSKSVGNVHRIGYHNLTKY